MQLYLDTSALVKVVAAEHESAALATYLATYRSDSRFTAALTRTELVRAVLRRGTIESLAHAHRVLEKLELVALNNRLLDIAAAIPPTKLRILDAIHLAAAMTARDLRAIVTYDHRLAEAATSSGIAVVGPS